MNGDLYRAVSVLADRQENGEPCVCGETSGHAGWLACAVHLTVPDDDELGGAA